MCLRCASVRGRAIEIICMRECVSAWWASTQKQLLANVFSRARHVAVLVWENMTVHFSTAANEEVAVAHATWFLIHSGVEYVRGETKG